MQLPGLRSFEYLTCVCPTVIARRAIKHGSDLINPLLRRQALNTGTCAAINDFFANVIMGMGKSRYLGQMRNAQHLMTLTDEPQFLTNHVTGTATDTNIDLIEDQRRHIINL